jgi:hypothetical protein
MKTYGYIKGDDDAETPSELKEVALSLSVAEIDSLIGFLQEVKKRFESGTPTAGQTHCHLRDLQKSWSKSGPDLVIVYTHSVEA